LGLTEIIATLSKSHVQSKDIVTEEEVEVFKQVMKDAGIKVHLHEELGDAISYGLANVENESVIILAGCQGMDYGAQIALRELGKLRPNIDKKLLFKPLDKRVAGIE
jgi:UDP-N-acetylmuramoyl-L-alanyl-D-glutamate--2,6-diaminopimelate ligase